MWHEFARGRDSTSENTRGLISKKRFWQRNGRRNVCGRRWKHDGLFHWKHRYARHRCAKHRCANAVALHLTRFGRYDVTSSRTLNHFGATLSEQGGRIWRRAPVSDLNVRTSNCRNCSSWGRAVKPAAFKKSGNTIDGPTTIGTTIRQPGNAWRVKAMVERKCRSMIGRLNVWRPEVV